CAAILREHPGECLILRQIPDTATADVAHDVHSVSSLKFRSRPRPILKWKHSEGKREAAHVSEPSRKSMRHPVGRLACQRCMRPAIVRSPNLTPDFMQIEFAGAAREVTGSCHIVRANGHTLLLDCGLFQGRRRDADAKNRAMPCPVDEIDAVVLSHAHLDHSGRLPLLTSRGYTGPIYATKATTELCAIMLADSARIQEHDYLFLTRHERPAAPPLYELKDSARVEEQMESRPLHEWFDVAPGIRVRYTDAGHILGSASVVVEATE